MADFYFTDETKDSSNLSSFRTLVDTTGVPDTVLVESMSIKKCAAFLSVIALKVRAAIRAYWYRMLMIDNSNLASFRAIVDTTGVPDTVFVESIAIKKCTVFLGDLALTFTPSGDFGSYYG